MAESANLKKAAKGCLMGYLSFLLPYILLLLLGAIILGYVFQGVFVPYETAISTAEVSGFTQITITGWSILFPSWNGCSSSDSIRFDVTATNPVRKRVSFYVCASYFKGGTIRVP
jgi:hypothetical protein